MATLVAAGGDFVPDRSALAAYVRTGAFEAPSTPYEGVTKVAPGHVVTLSREGAASRRYWRWSPGSRPAAPRAEAGSHDAFDVVLREAVRRQSDVEVPLGLMVSGGVDSSLLAAVLRELEPQRAIPAYVIRFREGSFDEGGPAEKVAQALRLDLVSAWVTPEDVPAELKRLVGTVGEPLGDPAWVPMAILARRAAEDIKVALVGEGADELFGGYPTYLGARLAGTYNAFPKLLQRALAAGVRAWPVSEKKVSVSSLLERFVAAAELPPGERHLQWLASVPDALLARLGLAAPPRRLDVPAGVLDALQQHDLETSLAEGLLTKSDRASMQAALELRAPFLDVDVMAFAEGLPERERVSGLTTKVFLKRHAERYLAREIVHRRKRGLSVPLATWLRGPLRAWAQERLRSPELARIGIRSEAARALLDEHATRRFDHARAIWTLAVLSEWLDWAAAAAARPAMGAATDAAQAG